MRPALLHPLFALVRALPGIGPKMAPLFDRLLTPNGTEARVVDLLFHLPTGAVDRRVKGRIADAVIGESGTFEVRAVEHRPGPPGRAKSPYRILVEDDTGDLTLTWFNVGRVRMESLLPIGETRYVSGIVELWDGHRQIVHPERVLDAAGLARMPAFEPVYGMTAGLYPRAVIRAVEAALPRLPTLPEWIDPPLLAREGWPSFGDALRRLHAPQALADLAPTAPARLRLAYDEVLAGQLALLLMRDRMKRESGKARSGDGTLIRAILHALPFALTEGQQSALADIRRDLAAPEKMLRLLQGDVGSGKTIVAFLAMATAIEAGWQTALMAPTEILARQHYERLKPLAEQAGITMALLTGRDKGQIRQTILDGLDSGAIALVVGTHALFQESVRFSRLGLAVIDEQHRFGVHQRLALSRKGAAVDVLVMTATPIPRTLVMTYFGDMDVSSIRDKPAGRQPIDTRALPLDRLGDVVSGLNRPLSAGQQVYWVCPLVEESEDSDLAAAAARFEELRSRFGAAVGLVHGKMKGVEKDAAMADFVAGRTKILVATTVIEVGVDVPNATIIIIEHAERFGLAQLHQLRGRVGRGADRSSCLLLFGPLGENGRARIDTMRRTQDGFEIAEEDLKLRGEGEVLGTRQSGLPGFRLAVPERHAALLATARADARAHLARDPALATPRGEALRFLLHVFEREDAVKFREAG